MEQSLLRCSGAALFFFLIIIMSDGVGVLLWCTPCSLFFYLQKGKLLSSGIIQSHFLNRRPPWISRVSSDPYLFWNEIRNWSVLSFCLFMVCFPFGFLHYAQCLPADSRASRHNSSPHRFLNRVMQRHFSVLVTPALSPPQLYPLLKWSRCPPFSFHKLYQIANFVPESLNMSRIFQYKCTVCVLVQKVFFRNSTSISATFNIC